MATRPTFFKSPNAVLDYVVDFAPVANGREGAVSDWLATDDSISTATVTASAGLTVTNVTHTTSAVTFWLSGGTAGQTYNVTCQIVTSQGRRDERTMRVMVLER